MQVKLTVECFEDLLSKTIFEIEDTSPNEQSRLTDKTAKVWDRFNVSTTRPLYGIE